jgi:hypothetical protein
MEKRQAAQVRWPYPAGEPGDRPDRPAVRQNRSGKRQVVVAMRERGGRTLAQVFPAEADAVTAIRQRIAKGTTVHETRARRGIRCMPASPSSGSTTRTAASTAPASIARSPISPACAAANSDITPHRRTLSRPLRPGSGLARGLPSRQQRRAGVWRRRSISAATGNARMPLRPAAS